MDQRSLLLKTLNDVREAYRLMSILCDPCLELLYSIQLKQKKGPFVPCEQCAKNEAPVSK